MRPCRLILALTVDQFLLIYAFRITNYITWGKGFIMSIQILVSALMFTIILFPWKAHAAEPVLWPSTSLAKVLRSDMPDESTPSYLYLYGTRGETVSGQAVFSPGENLDTATVSISYLRHHISGTTIPASAIKLQWVRYIDVQKNSSRIPHDELEIIAPNPMPDPFWEETTIPVKVGTYSILDNSVYIAYRSQPVWIEIAVPRTAEAGDYEGSLTVTGGTKPVELPVVLHVWNFDVPDERHLSIVTWWNLHARGFEKVEPYSKQYWERLKQFCEFVIEHRQTDAGVVPITIIEEKGGNSQDYTYDTGNLERYAEIAFAAGIRQIHLHSLGKLSESDRISGVGHGVLDRSRHVVHREDAFRRLPALEELMKRRGWEGKFLVNISDEPFMHHEESYAEVVDLVHKKAPNVRIAEAVEAEYLGKLDIYCPKINHLDMWYPTYKQHQANGAELWFYTSRIPIGRYPNRFVDCSLLKMRVQFWVHYLYGLDGYLFWALNSFYTDNPFTQEAIGRNSPLGNPAIAYPGKNGLIGSLRFSAQRDGIEDYEYMWVLEDKLRKIKNEIGKEAFWLDPRQRPLELCHRVIWSFHDYTRDPDVMLDTRRVIAEEIEALQTEPLLIVQTSPPEGTVFPEAPRNLGIRGLVTPGATVTINGEEVKDIRPSGYFRRYHFLLDDEPVITINAEYKGRKKTVSRTFKLID